MPIMYMRLEGVMQSYGYDDSWENRGSASVPTKSAVMGMLGAAFGYGFGSSKIAELSKQLKMSVRDNKGTEYMKDFQMIHAYRVPDLPGMERPYINKLQDIRRANGTLETHMNVKYSKKWISTDGKLRNKMYLAGSSFTVFLEGEQQLLESICNALINPVWPIYLGRKTCIPSRPIVGIITNENNIENAWKYCDVETSGICVVEYENDNTSDEIGVESFTRKDNFGENYEYQTRNIYRKKVTTCT